MTIPPLRPVTEDELLPDGVRGSRVTTGEFILVCGAVGAASFFLANDTDGISIVLGLVGAPLIVSAIHRQRGSTRAGATGVGIAAAIATVAVWLLCLVGLLIAGAFTGASSPV